MWSLGLVLAAALVHNMHIAQEYVCVVCAWKKTQHASDFEAFALTNEASLDYILRSISYDVY